MAIFFEKKKEQSTTDSEQELGRGNRKKRKIEYSGSSASDLEEMPPPPPKLKRVVEKGSSISKETPASKFCFMSHDNLLLIDVCRLSQLASTEILGDSGLFSRDS